MTFDETLAALLSLIGRKVSVKITAGAPGTPQVTIAFMDGELTRAADRGPSYLDLPEDFGEDQDAIAAQLNEHDTHFFVLGQGDGTGFYLDPRAFNDARWLGEEGHTLWIEHGPDVVIAVVSPRP